PIAKTITWWYVASGEYIPRKTITYDLIGKRWAQHPYRQAIASSAVGVDSNGKLHLIVTDSTNGKAWYAEGATDGVPSSSPGAYTAAAPLNNTTVITVNEPLPTSGAGLVGAMLYRPDTGEECVITANNASKMTLGTALRTDPTLGEAMYVGAIPWTVTTNWWVGRGLQDKKRPVHLALKLSPSSTGSVKVYLYLDFSATPYVFTNPDAADYPDGVTIVDGRNYITVDLDAGQSDGFVPIPMPEDWGRSMRAKVVCESPAGDMRLLDVSFAVEDPAQEAQETAE
ncbi:MAG: hypothetical protein H0U59_02575, partial [Gemmatimonadaceae bacterium]|nr:hypothetical protein [Gemmatimonadaceae bacterium]